MELIVICGPTAAGKTAAAIHLAKNINTEIISADARQVYKEMSIGTAVPSTEELVSVPHHFIQTESIQNLYSAGQYARDAQSLLKTLFQKHDKVVMVGGSGLYINAVCFGLDDTPPADEPIRQQLQQDFESHGISFLQEKLKSIDEFYYKQMPDNMNPQRLMRAIEIVLVGGKSNAYWLLQKGAKNNFKVRFIGINTDREKLYKQINTRVLSMMDMGLLKEAEGLYNYRHLNALQTVGYTELFDFFEGKHSLEKAIELIQQHTRNYAKRQITWFKRMPDITWCEPNGIMMNDK